MTGPLVLHLALSVHLAHARAWLATGLLFEPVLVSLLVALVACGLLYHLVSLWAALRFSRMRAPKSGPLPGVSILKPVRGVDPAAYENYASFCRLDYPDYEVLFGLQDPADPAIELIERLQAAFPEVRLRLVVANGQIGANRKVCNLHNLLASARHELLVISDSDMRVRPEYLRDVAAYFQDPEVGLVTSPYCGRGARSVPAALEALGMATDFFPGVAVATQLAPPGFGLGSTLALHQKTLAKIGGFEALADYLADDFQMGHRVARGGKRVVLSRYVVETSLPNSGFGPMVARRLRWMRTARTCQPAGFAGSVITFSTVWALSLAALGGFHGWMLGLFLFQQAVRGATAAAISCGVLRSSDARRWFWLLPVSDLLCFVLWAGSWCGNTVLWRGHRYLLTGGGRMTRVEETLPPPLVQRPEF